MVKLILFISFITDYLIFEIMVRFWAFSILFFAYFNSYSQSCVDDGFWKIGSQFGTKRLSSNCGDYNCHGFAAAYWEGGLNTIPDWGISNPGSVTVASQYTFSGGGPDQNYF